MIGWVPTGWTYEHKKNAHPVKKRGNLSIHLVPYSEHSSYSELVEYVKFLKPQEVSHSLHPCRHLLPAFGVLPRV